MSNTINTEPDILLSEEQISHFWEHGYVSLSAITSTEELITLRTVFERLFCERAGRNEGRQFDMLTHDEDDAPARTSRDHQPYHLRTRTPPHTLSGECARNRPSASWVNGHCGV
jgi:hypothetical protein